MIVIATVCTVYVECRLCHLTTAQPAQLSYSHWSQVKAISWSGHSRSRRSQCAQSTAGCEGSVDSSTVCLLAHPRLEGNLKIF